VVALKDSSGSGCSEQLWKINFNQVSNTRLPAEEEMNILIIALKVIGLLAGMFVIYLILGYALMKLMETNK